MKIKELKFLEHPITKLVLIILLTLVLIMVSLILFEDVGLDNTLLIYNIYGTLALVSFLYSFHTTSKKLYHILALGTNRKTFYKDYLKNISIVFVISVFLVAYYIIVYKLIIGMNKPIFESFNLEILIYLPTLFLSLSFFGFLLGTIKLKKRFFYTLVTIVVILVVISIMYITIKYLISILLGLVVIGLGVLNYFVIKNINI